jgi:hypothetical protein
MLRGTNQEPWLQKVYLGFLSSDSTFRYFVWDSSKCRFFFLVDLFSSLEATEIETYEFII